MLFRKNIFFKIVLLKIARKTQKLRILRDEINQNLIFCVQNFFQNMLFEYIFFFKIVLFKNKFSSKSCFLKIFLSSKSDSL